MEKMALIVMSRNATSSFVHILKSFRKQIPGGQLVRVRGSGLGSPSYQIRANPATTRYSISDNALILLQPCARIKVNQTAVFAFSNHRFEIYE
jgi:hypothetical protein